ncbi:MAG: hypothetical protein KGI73_03870 [Patescibacteria group bacterium]|nr:hypothetical protein [Patescibacteria group bacterium]
MRHTRAHTANRRSHHALKGTRLTASKEGAVHPRHKMLLDGTPYRGRKGLDLQAKRVVRAQKAARKRDDTLKEEEKAAEKAA